MVNQSPIKQLEADLLASADVLRANANMKPRIFISYKRADRQKVFDLKADIETSTREKCWIDIDGIESDAQFKNVIINAIKDCEVVLFMYSKAHSQITDFEKDWTVRELNFAASKNKRIVFVNIDGTPLTDEFSFDYGSKQQVDGQSPEAIARLIKDLKEWLKPIPNRNNETAQTNIFNIPPKTGCTIMVQDEGKVIERIFSNGQIMTDLLEPQRQDEKIPGPSQTEQQNVNAISVTILDWATPIVFFFGAPSSGKTMALIRMIRWAESHGLQVKPERIFRPAHDTHYQRMCDNLNQMVYRNTAPAGNDAFSFMLVKVLDLHGRPLCQILEAPGEHFFTASEPNRDFPTYIQQIINSPNRKVWVFFCEKDWGHDQSDRTNYANAIKRMQLNINRLGKRARVVFLFNKADKFPQYYNSAGYPIRERFFTDIQGQYPGIFDNYRNDGLMKILHGRYNFKTLCYSVGSFTQVDETTKTWIQGDDWYCQQLWNAIK